MPAASRCGADSQWRSRPSLQPPRHKCPCCKIRSEMPHIRQSRPADSGLGFQVKVVKTLNVAPQKTHSKPELYLTFYVLNITIFVAPSTLFLAHFTIFVAPAHFAFFVCPRRRSHFLCAPAGALTTHRATKGKCCQI